MSTNFQSHYERKTGITTHAIERLRDRLNGDVKARSDEDLGNLIDHAVMTGIEIGAVTPIVDEGTPSQLVKLDTLPAPEPLYALVKPNERTNYRHKLVVITLFSQEMVDAAIAAGRWGSSTKREEPKKMTNMGSKLKGALEMAEMRGKPVAIAAVREGEPPVVKRADQRDAQHQREREHKTVEIYLVTWKRRERDDSGWLVSQQSAEYPKGEINQRMSELLDDTNVEAKSIRIWREVKTRVKVEVDVDE
jgi:hypothetical protein